MLMTPEIQQQLIYNLMNAEVRTYPCPHFEVHNVFPMEFYREIVRQLPKTEDYRGIYSLGRVSNPNNLKETRFVFNLQDHLEHLQGEQHAFWKSVADFFLSKEFCMMTIQKFMPFLQQRFPGGMPNKAIQSVAELFRDVTDYKIGPHTDHPTRLLNFFMYLPDDEAHPELGTSFYVPKDPNFICEGGPHHPFEPFIRVYTAPFKPNCAAGFFKTNRSFHGVEPISIPNFARNVLGYYIRIEQ